MANKTLMMIKPDAVENGHIGNILEKVTSAGFKIKALKLTQLTKRDAEAFYEVHNERPFFGELVSFMTRGPIVAALLEKENAVSDFRTLIGATNPAEAAEGVPGGFGGHGLSSFSSCSSRALRISAMDLTKAAKTTRFC